MRGRREQSLLAAEVVHDKGSVDTGLGGNGADRGAFVGVGGKAFSSSRSQQT